MKNGIRKKIYFSAAALWFLLPGSFLFAQDSFREFDRKLVATPAELYEILSTLNPSAPKRSLDAKNLKAMEEAGRNFLSKLSPQQQEKAWEFAEKYLRKNGVDAASSKELMKEFGLPPEMQNELRQQFRKFGSRRTGGKSDKPYRDANDEISQLLQKARERFDQSNRTNDVDARKKPPAGNPAQTKRQPLGNEPQNGTTKNRPQRNSSQADRMRSNRSENSDNPGVRDTKPRRPSSPQGDIDSPFNDPSSDNSKPLSDEQLRQQFENRQNSGSNGLNRNPNTNRDRTNGNAARSPKDPDSNGSTDSEIDKLLEKLGGLKKQADQNSSGNLAGTGRDVDWEKLIENIAERKDDIEGNFAELPWNRGGSKARPATQGNESGSGSQLKIDKGMLDRAKELVSRTFKSANKKNAGGSGRFDGSNERIGTRFDRLLVKAVDRTLNSEAEDGFSDRVGGMLGGLIERFQDQANKKEKERDAAAGRQSSNRNGRDRQSDRPSSRNSDQFAGGSSGQQDRSSSSSQPGSGSSPSATETPSLGSGKLSDLVPDLSAINPSYVFGFFALVGCIVFVGYLLAQSIAGNEAEVTKRAVIKKVRSTKIQSPKDLVETVDMFLLAKFGIKSSWWNANLAQRVLHSGSPELKAQVDELFRDYVRARYMRSDIQIPTTDQQRFRKTLEQLSKLDIKPQFGIGYVPSKPNVSLEG